MARFPARGRRMRHHSGERVGRRVLLALAVVFGLCWVGLGQTPTTTTLVSNANPSAYGQSVTFTATVTPVPDGGTVTFKNGGVPISPPVLVNTTNGQAQFATSSLSTGVHSITADYSGTANFSPSTSAPLNQTVNKRQTTTLVMGSDTALVVGDTVTVTVRVVDTSPGETSMPTGNVTVSVSPVGQGTPTSWSRTLVAADAGQFTFTYTPSSAATTPHTFTATYAGDTTHGGSSGSFAQGIVKRAADMHVSCSPTTAYIGQPVAVTVAVEDDTTVGTPSIPTGTITFDDGGKNGVFSSNTAPLTGGVCSVTYTPGAWDAGTTVIAATYSGSNVHAAAARGTNLQVLLRPTETTIEGSGQTLLVSQSGTYTVTVTDVAGVGTAPAPAGTLAYSSYLGADASITPTDTSAPDGGFTYRCLGLDGHAGIDTLYANYTANDGIHASSTGYYGQGIQRRPTITTLSNCTSTPTGVTCTATVAEDPGNAGTPSNIQGNLVRLDTGVQLCGGLSGMSPSCTFNLASTLPLVNVSVRYVPTDRVHLESTASQNVSRFDQFPPDPGDGSTGANCTDGCGTGGVNVAQMIFDLNAAEIALKTVKWGLDITALVLDVIPDGVIVGGLIVSTGVTIPYSDIAKAIVAGAGIALDIAIEAMDTDLDDDGIPDVLENSVTGTDYRKWDTDGDGLGDLDEIEAAGGYYGGSRRPNPNVADSDGDGLSDGDEDGLYRTNFCVVDTDCDGVGDGVEVNTWSNADPRNHSDPLIQDTDGDGLRDDREITAGCPFVNDDDSDDDGLQDGYEDRNRDGIITNTIGNSTTEGSGETHFCMWDTDGDGLSDGEEEALFGAGPITAITRSGAVITVAALDDDSDNDGLSDWEEVNVTGTNPLHWDTDRDGLSDADELIATGGAWPKRTFRQVSDPLTPDTDNDGLLDGIEWSGSGLGTTYLRGLGGDPDTACPFVDNPDSDSDGLLDGHEDQNKDGIWNNYQIGNSTLQGWGETCACNPDSDGDGLQDGEEEGLLGRTATPQGVSTVLPMGTSTPLPGYIVLAGSMRGTGNDLLAPYVFAPMAGPSLPQTVPALDTDSDNDGLSDWEEVNVTGTDPLDADTDSDTLADADELVAVSGTWPNRQFDQVSSPFSTNTDGDHLFDPQEFAGSGLRALAGGLGGTRDLACPYVNDADSDDDGIQDGAVVSRTVTAAGVTFIWNHYEDFGDIAGASVAWPGAVRTVVTPAGGEQNDDAVCNLCDTDSDGDGLLDGEEAAIGTDPGDWDTDDDGRNDWHEVTGGGPIPTDPFDPDTDDDGLLDSAEVFGSNPTNPVNCDTDGDGLCDGGNRTPYMTSGHPSVLVNPRCLNGIGGHPNPLGIGEDEDGEGDWDSAIETDPNNPDTDGDAVGDGIEVLGFSVNRQHLIPTHDSFGRPILVIYPSLGCMDPLNPDTDGDGLLDGEEDLNHDGHFDFHPGDIDIVNYPHGPFAFTRLIETNPCSPDTDGDGLDDWEERYGLRKSTGHAFSPTNPLDHDTDNDWLLDGEEIDWVCTEMFVYVDPLREKLYALGDQGLSPEDIQFALLQEGIELTLGAITNVLHEQRFDVRFVQFLDPTNRDSDSDGFIDGLDPDACNSQPIPIVGPVVRTPVDSDGDGFSDDDEIAAGTDRLDPTSFPHAFTADLDLNDVENDRLWLTDSTGDGTADYVTIDFHSNMVSDVRLQILARDVEHGDFSATGAADDCRYTVSYAVVRLRGVQARWITLVIYDYRCDLKVNRVEAREPTAPR